MTLTRLINKATSHFDRQTPTPTVVNKRAPTATLNGMMTTAAPISVAVSIHVHNDSYIVRDATVTTIKSHEDVLWKGTIREAIPPHQTNRVVAKTVVTIIVTITVNAGITINVEMIIADPTTMIETTTIINVLRLVLMTHANRFLCFPFFASNFFCGDNSVVPLWRRQFFIYFSVDDSGDIPLWRLQKSFFVFFRS